jgi:hypothetical protein
MELIPLIQAVSKGATTPKNSRAHCIPLPPVMLPPVKRPKVEATPLIEGVALSDETPVAAAATTTATPRGKGAKRKKSAEQAVAPVEVAASSAA